MRSQEQTGSVLDLAGFKLVFDEEFDKVDVSAWGPNTRWIAHTPWAGDFGDADFVDPRPTFPFTVSNGILSIRAQKGSDGKWRSGLLASVDRNSTGFLQQYGYFEIRTKLPQGDGLWPSFWLIGRAGSEYTAEIDVFEHHGHKPDRFSSAVHAWDRTGEGKTRTVGHTTSVPASSLYDRFNTFGVMIDSEFIRIYFNRVQVWQTPTPPQHRQPMYVLLNLAMGSGWPVNETPSPSDLLVDYVKVWGLDQQKALIGD